MLTNSEKKSRTEILHKLFLSSWFSLYFPFLLGFVLRFLFTFKERLNNQLLKKDYDILLRDCSWLGTTEKM